jgi:hypothetical protein
MRTLRDGAMAISQKPYGKLLQELATLMIGIAGESVTMVKRSAPEQALKLKQPSEWSIYLEFLKVMFNLTDRMSVYYLPIQEQPQFMDSLEDAVTARLRAVLTPALGPDGDEMEIALTIGRAVADSRRIYERFRFVVTEDSRVKNEFFACFAERVAGALQAPGNPVVTSAATLCASAALPAMKSLFEEVCHPGSADRLSPSGKERRDAAQGGPPTVPEIKLLSVVSTIQGEEVETRWGLHPRFRQDLKPEEAQEITRLMNRVTQLLGERYAAVAFSPDWASWHRTGHA